MKRVLPAAILLAAFASPLLAQVENPIAPIQTNSGKVAGTVMASGVEAWLGVPFAKPPVDALRWMPPQPIAWKGVWNADRKMPECMQVIRPHNINNYFGDETISENCLYLNIWAPPGATAAARLPVIVYIYGGGGTLGSGGSAMFDGENMARKGVIFATLNYRVGILGWMAHPELTKEQGGHSGNYAYLDQVAALKWIHDNIAGFGGDPGRVTIHGQSAGAAAVGAHLHSPLSKGLFSAALMSSTCSIGAGNTPTLAEAEKVGLDIQKRLGANNLEDMRNIAADKLLQLQAESQIGYNNTTGVRTGPVIDGYFTVAQKEDVAKAHQMSDVPAIANFNGGESSSPLQQARSVADYARIAAALYGPDAPAFLKLYPVAKDADIPAIAAKVARESAIANASRNCGVMQNRYNKSPLFIDMFDHKQSYAPGVKFLDHDPATVGAYHNGDTIYWFENLDAYNLMRHTRDWKAADHQLADQMSDALIAFARTGNPSTPALKWPAWTPASDVYVDFNIPPKVEKFNTAGMAWLAAHPPQRVAAGATPA